MLQLDIRPYAYWHIDHDNRVATFVLQKMLIMSLQLPWGRVCAGFNGISSTFYYM